MRSVASFAHPNQAASRSPLKHLHDPASLLRKRCKYVRAEADESTHSVSEAQSSALKHTTRPEVQGFQVAVLLVQQWTYNFVVSQSSSAVIAGLLMLDMSSLDANQLAASALLAQALQLSGTIYLLTQFCEKINSPISQTVWYSWDNGKPVLLAAAAAVTTTGAIYAWGQLMSGAGDVELARAAQEISPLTYVSIFLAPVSEELLFRGVILGWLLKCWCSPVGAPLSIAVSSICFAAFHASSEGVVPLTLFGLVIGSAYCASGSLPAHISSSDHDNGLLQTSAPGPLNLVVPTLAHIMYNAVASGANAMT